MLFSDYFNIDKKLISEYGSINISLSCDIPLFIDPILIYNNENEKIRNLYPEIVKYLLFLKKKSTYNLSNEDLKYYFTFKEIPQNWLGLSKKGNKGLALGIQFAKELFDNIHNICNTSKISKNIHVEKMFLLNRGVGKDKISDMITNILLEYFIKYTEEFAQKYIDKKYCSKFSIPKAKFDYKSELFFDIDAYLPFFINEKGKKEFVILMPKSILRKDEQEINYEKMISTFDSVKLSISNEDLRYHVNKIINDTINDLYEKKKQTSSAIKKTEIYNAKVKGIENSLFIYPELYDYFIKFVEDNSSSVADVAKKEIDDVNSKLIENKLLDNDVFDWNNIMEFKTAKDEAIYRINYLKNKIENCGLWKNLYYNGIRISQESDIQRLFHLVWGRTKYMFSAEVNDGSGPVDFKISFGQINSCIIEFKLASNSRLNHVFKQVESYKKSSSIKDVVIVIFSFDENEMLKANSICSQGKEKDIEVITIDCNCNNKKSASKN